MEKDLKQLWKTLNRKPREDNMANIINAILWLLVLIFVSFWIAGFCAFLYIIVHPLSVCIPPLTGIADVLLSGLQFPHYCAESMVSGSPLFK